MAWKIFYITVFYLAAAALIVFLRNRKCADAGARWMKLVVYAFIVLLIENAIAVVKPFPFVCAGILLAGLNEIIFAWRWHEGKKWYSLLLAVLLFAGLGYAFFYFSLLPYPFEQLYVFMISFSFSAFRKWLETISGKKAAGIIAGMIMALLSTWLLKDFFTMDIYM